ncbi:accessory gene regulator B [Clostridium sp. DSM 8431]|uniref:accessory gene regulator B family protein n=1 Tax=Clostridium sp. DSM 8431 TaxID=1761781 RepID=UPI0008ED7237|nr:accessory gene regulator B family protein [Clostridium sp. DSM 8431]SFU39924.1 accessory gene regulator B [Clostridium sp. DSM 8431]
MKKLIIKDFDIWDYIAKKLTIYIGNSLNLNIKDLEKLYLGIMVILLNLSKITIVCIFAFLIGIFKETVILLGMFSVIRLSAAGIHLKSNFQCTIACLVMYLGGAFLAVNYPINIRSVLLIIFILLIILYKYSPADTENRPILGKKHRKELKIRTIKSSLILVAINVVFLNSIILNLLMYAFFIQTICVIPFTYRVFGMKYNNYKEYDN